MLTEWNLAYMFMLIQSMLCLFISIIAVTNSSQYSSLMRKPAFLKKYLNILEKNTSYISNILLSTIAMFSHYYSTESETCVLKLIAYFHSLIDVTCYLLDSSKKMNDHKIIYEASP